MQKKIFILNIPYKICEDYTFEELGGRQGLFDSVRQTIFIAQELEPEAKRYTLIHEVIEAVNYHLELNLEHRQITGIEVGFFTFLEGLLTHPQLSDETIDLILPE